VDDHPVFRRGLREILQESFKFRIAGEASNGEEAMRMVVELKPQIAIVDIDMPRCNGLEMMRALKKINFPVNIIFLTMYKEEDIFNAAMDLGVKGYVLKENAARDILLAVETVLQGETFVSPSISEMGRRRADRVQQLLLSKPQIDELTQTE